jgi:thioredoxin-like negative regulator of GroEL
VAREAVAYVDRSDELDHQAQARLSLAEALHGAGRTSEALDTLQEALERFEQKGNVVMTERTRALLDEPAYR